MKFSKYEIGQAIGVAIWIAIAVGIGVLAAWIVGSMYKATYANTVIDWVEEPCCIELDTSYDDIDDSLTVSGFIDSVESDNSYFALSSSTVDAGKSILEHSISYVGLQPRTFYTVRTLVRDAYTYEPIEYKGHKLIQLDEYLTESRY